MQIEKRLKNYYKRWNIDLEYEDQFLKCKNRLIGTVNKLMGDYLIENPDINIHFIEILNFDKADDPDVKKSRRVYKPSPSIMDSLLKDSIRPLASYAKNENSYTDTEKGFGDTDIFKHMDACQTPQELAKVLQILFWALEEKHDEIKEIVLEVVKKIKKISMLTPSSSFVIYKKGKQFIIYPNGDQFLDSGIIDCTLSGLEDYPEVAKHFEKALGIYQSGEVTQYRNLLDNLRFALEQLLKKILGNQKSLENQKNYLLPWLKEKGLHSQVVNLYERLLSTYQDYQNSAVKHNEAFSFNEVEFMIYLTGNFMRLVLQLSSQTNDTE